jgi:hypothetical protein
MDTRLRAAAGPQYGGIPLFVLTKREDHELVLLVVEKGAADNVTRGQFSTDP